MAPTSFRPALVLLMAAAGIAGMPGAAQAQSGYVMTTLKPPSSGQVAMGFDWRLTRSFGIDSADNVIGPASYFAGWYWDSNAPHLRIRYDPHIVRWPAGTTASVSPVKLLKAPNWTYMSLDVSTDARKVLIYSKGQAVFDVATAQLAPAMPSVLDGIQVSNAGAVLWQSKDGSGTSGTWSATSGTTTVPAVAHGGMYARWQNNAGVLVGATQRSGDVLPRAAKWANGQVTVLDPRPGDVGSEALLINDVGQVLISSTTPYCHGFCEPIPDTQGLLENGVYTPIAFASGPVSGQVQSQAMNNRGDVVGCLIGAGGSYRDCRGFLWKDRTLYDLTDLMRAKGVAIPAGAYFRFVSAINDKGTMVAELVPASGAPTVVRLTPRP